MNRLQTRIKKLENETGLSRPIPDIFAIFPGPGPVTGWQIKDNPDVIITRLDGESEEKLEARAVEVANAMTPRRHPVLFVQMRR